MFRYLFDLNKNMENVLSETSFNIAV
uniref:Uncharacterized protein n=1 Tax=Arundo donax TaxID=35708 RepID=A0A0A8Z5P7_ARUDO